MGKESDLIKAVKHNDGAKLQKLLLPDKGYNVKRNTWSESPLSPRSSTGRIRVELGHIDINCHERNTEYTPLILATLNGNKNIAETLIFHSADVDGRDVKGNTALHMAVFAGELDFIEMFLQNGASVNSQNNDGNTPLHIACQGDGENKVQIILKMLNKGADSDKRNKKGISPLDEAAMFNKKDAVSLLLDHAPCLRENTMAIVEAATRGYKDIVELLLEYGINPNSFDVLRCTCPLHEAVRFLRFDAARVLLAFGASTTKENTVKETPESLARDLPKAMCDKFLAMFKEFRKAKLRLPKFYGENGNDTDDPGMLFKDYPLLPNSSKWTKNTPDFCSTCTEKNTNAHAVDDNPYTFWVIPAIHHAWMVLDLQQDHVITGISIFGWDSPQMVKQFELQISDNVKGPWKTCLTAMCDQLGSSDPKEPGVPQTFKKFEEKSRYFRFYIRSNHGGSCITFQGIQLHGVEEKVSSILDSARIVENKDNIISQNGNTYLKLLKMEDELIKKLCGAEDATPLLETLQNMRENEFPLSTLDWLRVPITTTRAIEELPDFSVQSDPDVCQTVEVYLDNGKLLGNTKVRLIPASDEEEASVAIFSGIKFQTDGNFILKVRSISNPGLYIEAPEPILVRPAAHTNTELDAAFAEIQNMLSDAKASLDFNF